MNRWNERSQWFTAAAGFIAAAVAALLPACGTPPSDLIDDRYRGQTIEGDSDLGSTAQFSKHAVAADHPEASQAGAEMLARGGNAVDAAVATSFALSVVRPESCGIGGGGFMLIHLAKEKRTVVIDYRERAPANASPEMFEHLAEGASRWSGRAVAVPATVKGLLHAHERYGTLHRRTVLAPAIRLARLGAVYDRHAARSAIELAAFLEQNPGRPADETAAIRSLLQLDRPPQPIDDTSKKPATPQELDELHRRRSLTPMEIAPRLRNPAQADVLERIAAAGADGFYKGDVAEAIVAAVNRHGGGLTLADLAGVAVRETAPLIGQWGGYNIHTMPLPSSGGVTLLQALALMDRTKAQWEPGLAEFKANFAATEAARQPGDGLIIPDTAQIAPYAHALTESFKHAFADRAPYLGDPAFMPADPTPRLLEPARLDAKARRIDPARTLDDDAYANTEVLADLLSHAGSPREDHGTSHFSVVDQWGNAVACTETINLSYGSRILVKEFGFFLNNQMDDFQTRRGQANAFGLVQSDRNLPQPGKVPLSSMTPTIVLDEHGKVHTVVGASGGPRIITGVAQSLLFARDFGLGASAVDVPRIHHQWKPSQLRVEPFGLPYAFENSGSFGPSLLNPESMIALGDAALAGEDDKLTPPFVAAMQARGHEIKPMFEGAAVQMIQRIADGSWHAASDPRKGGAPAGE